MCVRGIDFTPFYNLTIGYWICADSEVLFSFYYYHYYTYNQYLKRVSILHKEYLKDIIQM